MNRETIHLYTDGGIRPCNHMPAGSGYGGAGAVAVNAQAGLVLFEQCVYYDTATTNQKMELRAVINGLTVIKGQLPIKEAKIVVHTDSAYIVNCIVAKWWFNWVVRSNGAWLTSSKKPVENAEYWRELLSLCSSTYHQVAAVKGGRPWVGMANQEDADAIKKSCHGGLDVSFIKVKGHSGVPLNERADALATEGKNGATRLVLRELSHIIKE